jgi:pilus assembly protein Flp/PilA
LQVYTLFLSGRQGLCRIICEKLSILCAARRGREQTIMPTLVRVFPAAMTDSHALLAAYGCKIVIEPFLTGKEVRRMLRGERRAGQGLVEYALILVLVVLVVIVALTAFGPTIGNAYSRVNSSLP